MNEELKPCPCGSTDLTIKEAEHWTESDSVCCIECTFSASLEDWNTRTPMQGIAAEMYELLKRAKEVMLNTYDVTDYPADGDTDCDKCAAEIDQLLSEARGEHL